MQKGEKRERKKIKRRWGRCLRKIKSGALGASAFRPRARSEIDAAILTGIQAPFEGHSEGNQEKNGGETRVETGPKRKQRRSGGGTGTLQPFGAPGTDPAPGSSALSPHNLRHTSAISAYSDGQYPPRLLLIRLCLC